MASSIDSSESRFNIRPATKDDVPALTDTFFHSFNAPFWQYFLPDIPYMRNWWDEAWAMGLDNPTDRTFVVEDTRKGNKVIAFVPQEDGNQSRKWPAIEGEPWDMEVVGDFFGGMARNRHELMGKRSHWFLEMLGVHEDYQRQGLGGRLIQWGSERADKAGLETYLDGSEKGTPYYVKHHGFHVGKAMEIRSRPAYGEFRCKSCIRSPQGTK